MTAQATERPPVLPVPKRAASRPFYKGLLVAANTKMDEVTGLPVFGRVDSEWVQKAWVERLCQLCGKKIAKTDFACFPGSMEDFRYAEAPLHVECAAYSITVCPNIIRKRATYAFLVCKRYEVTGVEPGDWRDSYAYPTGEGLSEGNRLALYMAHKSDCDHDSLQRVTYDEMLTWAGRYF